MDGIYKKTPQLTSYSVVKHWLFSLKLGSSQGCLLSPLLFNTVLEVLDSAIRQEKEITGIQIGKGEIQTPPYSDDIIFFFFFKIFTFFLLDDIILYIENPKEFTKNLLNQ